MAADDAPPGTVLKGKNNKSAGIFNHYANTQEVLDNGWYLVKANNNEFGLVDLDENCVSDHLKIPNI